MTQLLDPRAGGPARPAAGARRRRAARAFNAAGVIEAPDAHAARRRSALAGEPDNGRAGAGPDLRSVRHGSVCLDLATWRTRPVGRRLAWPAAGGVVRCGWRPAAGRRRSRCCAGRADGRVCSTSTATGARRSRCATTWWAPPRRPALDEGRRRGADRSSREGYDEQRAAARARSPSATTVLTGGPGTGKTTTVAGLLALRRPVRARPARAAHRAGRADRQGRARLQEAVEAEVADLPDATGRWPRPRGHPAPAAGLAAGHRVAVPAPPPQPAATRRRGRRRGVDGLADDDGPAARGGAARLPADPGRRPEPARVGRGRCGARRPGRRRPGDDRSASPPCDVAPVRRVDRPRWPRRSAPATPTRGGLLEPAASTSSCSTPTTPPPAPRAGRAARRRLPASGRGGDADRALQCSTSTGCCAPTATDLTACGTGTPRSSAGSPRTPGCRSGRLVRRPSAAGDRQRLRARLFNGDTGVVVRPPAGGPARRSRAAIAGPSGRATSPPPGSPQVETMHAMTVHKSQGSQADEVV